MNKEQQRALALAQARRRRAEAEASAAPTPDTSLAGAFVKGIDQTGAMIGGGIESIGELIGSETLRSKGEAQRLSNEEDIARRNAQRPEGADGILSNLREGEIGDAAKSFLYGVTEGAPQVGAGIGASLGAIGAATLGGLPALASGAAATVGTALGITQSLGETRSEKTEKGLDPTANLQDLGAAIASGVIELVPVGKGAGFTLKFTKEAAQEFAQEGIVIGNTAIQGGEYVSDEVVNRMVDAGIIGGAVSKGADLTIKGGVKAAETASAAVDNVRTDNISEVTNDDVEVRDRLMRHAGDDMSILGNVDHTDTGSARSIAEAARLEAIAEAQVLTESLMQYAKTTNNEEARVALKTLSRQVSGKTAEVTDAAINRVSDAFGDVPVPDVQRLASVARQTNRIQQWTKGAAGDMGGLTQNTRLLDITDRRRNMALGSLPAMGAGVMSAGGTTLINRGARVVDKLLNTRSRVKRFVDTVDKARTERGVTGQNVSGPSARLQSQEIKDAIKEATEAERHAEKEAKAAERALQKLQNPSAKAQQTVQTVEQKAKHEALLASTREAQAKLNAAAFGRVAASQEVPATAHPTWQMFSKSTGMTPEDTLSVLEQLEREGMAPEGTARNFVEQPSWFKDNPQLSIELQQEVRARGNPSFTPDADAFTPKKPKADPQMALAKLNAAVTTPGDRRKFRAINGERESEKVRLEIVNAERTLSPDQMDELNILRSVIDSPAVTISERSQIVKNTLQDLWPRNPTMRAFWQKKFSGLVAAGNLTPIYAEDAATTEQKQKQDNFEKKKSKAKPTKKRSTLPTPANSPDAPKPAVADGAETPSKSGDNSTVSQSEVKPTQPKTKADKALDKLNETARAPSNGPLRSDPELDQSKTDASKVQDAAEPQPKLKKDAKKKLALKDRIFDRVDTLITAVENAEIYGDDLYDYLDQRSSQKSADARLEVMMIEVANDKLTQNQLTDMYAEKYDIPPVEAAQIVNSVLERMEGRGEIKRFRPSFNSKLMSGGKLAKDANTKKPLDVVQIEFTDPDLKGRVELMKEVKMRDRMVDPNYTGDYTPDQLQIDGSRALKDIPANRVDGTFWPILNFLNRMRSMTHTVSPKMLEQIEQGLPDKDTARVGVIGDVLLPQSERSNRRDEGPLKTVAQLLFQLGTTDERQDPTIRQEWSAGRNLRVYSKNGLAHSQSGDLMKGILRSAEAAPLGGQGGFNYLMHGLGNLLGYDKEAPADRRNAIFRDNTIDELVKFAENPFKRGLMVSEKTKKETDIGRIINDGEGFFQVLNVANEVSSLVDFARARHKDKSKLSNKELLSHPDVQADISQNYTTDFIVQLDASNNAYQIAGMVMGNPRILQATGVLPPDGDLSDPDSRKGADIYLEPAKAIAQNVPALVELDLPDSALRKIFKGPIGNYLYAAQFESRRNAFADKLTKLAGGKEIFGIKPDEGLITVPEGVVDGMMGDGFVFSANRYDQNGDVKAEENVLKRVVPLEVERYNGKSKKKEKRTVYKIETTKARSGATVGGKIFDTPEDAIKATYGMHVYKQMSREMVRDLNTRYPEIRDYLKFADTVAKIAKDRVIQSIKVPTKDGMMLEYSFKDDPTFVGVDVPIGDRTATLGIRGTEANLRGRGLAAFMTHQLDAWVMREVANRMGDVVTFNPIHDSFGWHPQDAERGQAVWVEVMQEIGAGDYNLFLQILEANNIDLNTFVEAGGNKEFIMSRRGVNPVPAKQIPTALS